MKLQQNINDVMGIFFNNGMQGICEITDVKDDIIEVDHLYQINGVQDQEGRVKVSFEPVSPFMDLSDKGLTCAIPWSAVLTLYPVEESLQKAYKDSISSIIVASSSIIS